MSRSGPKSIKSLSAEILRRFGRQSQDLAALCGRWPALVGEPMAAHSEPIELDAGRLTVIVDGPAWASRVRQQQAGLLRTLRSEPTLRGLREIRVQVQPTKPLVAPTSAPTSAPSRMSHTAARLVRGVAQSVDDPQLRAALLRLGELGERDEK